MWEGDFPYFCLLSGLGWLCWAPATEFSLPAQLLSSHKVCHRVSWTRGRAGSCCWLCDLCMRPNQRVWLTACLISLSCLCWHKRACATFLDQTCSCQSVNPDKNDKGLHWLRTWYFSSGDPRHCAEALQYDRRCDLMLIEGICQGGKCGGRR